MPHPGINGDPLYWPLPGPDRLRARELTPRQTQILCLLCEGLCTKQIARRLGCSPHTVAAHLMAAKNRLRIYTRVELVIWAVRNGLVSIDIEREKVPASRAGPGPLGGRDLQGFPRD